MTSRSEPAAVLASLNPIGVGTAMAESLDSYAHRLAIAHRVPRYCIDALIESGANVISRPKRAVSQVNLNTPSEVAKRYSQRVAALTERFESQFLGIGHLASVVGRIHACSHYRKWCSECLWEMEYNKALFYWPQLWSLTSYRVCHVHRTPMEEKCPYCRSVFSPEKEWGGHLQNCSKCNASLALAPGTSPFSKKSFPVYRVQEDGYEVLAARELAELVAMLPTIIQGKFALAIDLDFLMEHCRKFGIATSQRELGRRARMLTSTLNAIARKKHVPTLQNLVSLAVVSGVSLVGLLCVDFWRVNPGVDKMAIRDFEFPDRRGRKCYQWEDAEEYVMKEISKGNAELPWPMAKKLGICEKQFCLRLPDASKALRAAVLQKDKALFSGM